MATTETELGSKTETPAAATPTVKVVSKTSDSLLDKALRLLSSVRFGVTMLGILLVCCMIGMLIVQVTVTEPAGAFDRYYASLTPSQRAVYGALNFFDIYRSRYFMLLMAITALNIILASIDRFPAAWQYVRKPKVTASPKFIAAQMFNAESFEREPPQTVAEKVRGAWKAHGFKARVNEENNRITVFAQRHPYNRLGAYIVHVALLTIFTGGMLTSRGSTGGPMEIKPGKSTNKYSTFDVTMEHGPRQTEAELPFQIECRDLQQKLIRPEGGLDAQNTIDWLSYITIKDGDVQKEMLVHLNNVGNYRGYRFFQSQFMPVGNAREITISFDPVRDSAQAIQPVKIMRNGSTQVPGIGTVKYVGFYADFDVEDSGPVTKSRDYNNPAAQLEITSPDGKRSAAFALNPRLADEYISKADDKIAKEGGENPLLVNGYKVILRDFEKVSTSHTLTIQKDPGRTPVYIGFTLLVLALCFVFFLSHQRVWAVIEPDGGGSKIYFGGNTNRNRPAFEGRFNLLVQSAMGRSKDE
ncbi:MAG TPA: cytochrome c biogenesis protein ResB [Blastocatellia bacterium]|nr:cytochrome c biogenesis protein ResB [Blastocatellia bacterium]